MYILIKQFVFPCGVDICYNDEPPKFYSITCTNENVDRSYIYILRIMERIAISELNEVTVFPSNNNNSKYILLN
jgi:hypothetical protein